MTQMKIDEFDCIPHRPSSVTSVAMKYQFIDEVFLGSGPYGTV